MEEIEEDSSCDEERVPLAGGSVVECEPLRAIAGGMNLLTDSQV